jgi:dienelactone hydrolase
MKKVAAFPAVVLLAVGCERPPPAPVENQKEARQVREEARDASSGSSGTREEVAFPSGPRTLTGYLWLPSGPGPHRAIVFNHGSEHDPDDSQALAHFYNEHGFVFFVPIRRGHGKSPGRYIGAMRDEAPRESRQSVVVDELVAQVDDVVAALAYVSSRPEVRKEAVAVTGCSFGGIEVVLTAERPNGGGFKAAVDFAGGAMSWKAGALLRERMVAAVGRANIPIFFVQAENDFDTAPTKVLSDEMARLNKPHAQKIFPPNGTTPRQGHLFCRNGAEVWGPEVLAWLDVQMP